MAAPRQHKLLLLDDDVIHEMARDKTGRFLGEFPFLRAVRDSLRDMASCGSCAAKNAQAKAQHQKALAEAKRHLGMMEPAKKSLLKSLLGAEQVRVKFVDGRTEHKKTY